MTVQYIPNAKPLSLGRSDDNGIFISFLPTMPIHLLPILALSLLLTGCDNGDDSGAQTQQGPPPQVKVAYPLTQEVNEWDEFTGHIDAIDSVEVRARVTGYLEKINFVAGQKVKKGELLFVIDPKPFQAQLNLARAELERAKSKRELAKNDLDRARNLLKAKAISGEEYDTRNKGYREAVAAVRSAEASVYAARLNLQYSEIHAPIDGRVGHELITEGNLVNGGSEASLLTTIVSTDPVYVYVDADERSILKYKRQQGISVNGLEAQLGVADEDHFPHHGQLDYISPSADPETGTVKLRGVFANPDELLSPGFFARMRIRASAPYTALLVPDRALGTDQAERFVWVLNQDNQAEYRRVVPGAHVGSLRVIKKGLTEQDRVLVEGLQKVRPGAKVAPEQISLIGEQ
nr:efflux RND transporter periplasmic adaptor subunit [Methylomarinum sp. Ch1-1]MDP4519695.1 efflux RND transporter periplasmic adaptor subunit [Methylomarinum sp. Ch1-1]